MTKKERIARVYARAAELGFSYQETTQLIKIERTLHRWSERECGTDYGCIERDEKTDKPIWRTGCGNHSWPIPDREKGALKRLGTIMRSHSNLRQYVQTDPRGCALYILRAEDIREGENIESIYTRGLAMSI